MTTTTTTTLADAIRSTYDLGRRARAWSDATDWAMVRREARDLFVAAVALTYCLGFSLGSAIHALNDRLARRDGAAIDGKGVSPGPRDPELSSLTVAELRKLARAAGQSRAWCRVARRAELLALLGE